MRRLLIVLLAVMSGLAGLTGQVLAEDRIELDVDRVLGNQDAPKALYIVPWQPLDTGQVAGLELQSLLAEQLQFLDPDQVARERELYELKKH